MVCSEELAAAVYHVHDGSFLKLNGEMLMKWLRAAGDDIHVLISS